jgi:hypothetical protein
MDALASTECPRQPLETTVAMSVHWEYETPAIAVADAPE